MSFIFGIALSDFGLIVADTRLYLTVKNGDNQISDSKPLDLKLPDGSSFKYGVNNRKFQQCTNGYVAYAGHALWGSTVLRELAGYDLSQINNVKNKISSTYEKLKEKVSSYIPDSKSEIDRTAFFVVSNDKSNIQIHAFDSQGKELLQGGNFCFHFPPEIDSPSRQSYQNTFENNFLFSNSINDAVQNIKLIVSIQNKIYLDSKTVSHSSEIGVIMKVGENNFLNKYLYMDTLQASSLTTESLIK